ncbi:MAG: aminotransferase class V-fold PLP-dependent enzyme [Candidatus Kapabacteria bacterium]|nr:aminotransferase class V-fold PLP-dependent enzyme [Candidatus Kapabacteria bacterium]
MTHTPQFGGALRTNWHLQNGIYFLNNGSFGATPISVLQKQSEWRERFEQQPVFFTMRTLPVELRNAASIMGEFMGAQGEDIVFVDNASTGVNTVLRSLIPMLNEGDELITTSHVYNAVRQTMLYVCSLTGARYIEVDVPFPLASPEEVVERVRAAITPRTRFAMFDHITSPTGLVFPVADLIALCKEHGILTMIDGAHAPGMIDLHLDSLGADWYTGNFHKWLFAPKGSAFLWTAKQHQPTTHSSIISHGYSMGYHAEFDFNGTKDWSPFLCAPDGLAFMQQLGIENVRRYNRTLALEARSMMISAVPQPLPAPESMLESLAAIVLPCAIRTHENPMADAMAIHDMLWDGERIEVPVFPFATGGSVKLLLRIAAQVFNEAAEYKHLCDVLPGILELYNSNA